MKKYFKNCLLPIAILTLIIMSAMFILPSGLFEIQKLLTNTRSELEWAIKGSYIV